MKSALIFFFSLASTGARLRIGLRFIILFSKPDENIAYCALFTVFPNGGSTLKMGVQQTRGHVNHGGGVAASTLPLNHAFKKQGGTFVTVVSM